jgi:hypothetical protein
MAQIRAGLDTDSGFCGAEISDSDSDSDSVQIGVTLAQMQDANEDEN